MASLLKQTNDKNSSSSSNKNFFIGCGERINHEVRFKICKKNWKKKKKKFHFPIEFHYLPLCFSIKKLFIFSRVFDIVLKFWFCCSLSYNSIMFCFAFSTHCERELKSLNMFTIYIVSNESRFGIQRSVKSFARNGTSLSIQTTNVHGPSSEMRTRYTHFQIPIGKVFFYDVQLLVREIVFGILNKLRCRCWWVAGPPMANIVEVLYSIGVPNMLGELVSVWYNCWLFTIFFRSLK